STSSYARHPDLHSLPTRRSSDLDRRSPTEPDPRSRDRKVFRVGATRADTTFPVPPGLASVDSVSARRGPDCPFLDGLEESPPARHPVAGAGLRPGGMFL